MAPKSEVTDLAVDDLKRRARRRLVGAVVIALAAAVILPMLLESDPKPVGKDVSIQIPPIDNGKFVTPLSPDKSPSAKSAGDAKPDAKSDNKAVTTVPSVSPPPVPAPPKRGLVEAEQHVLGQTSSKAAGSTKPIDAKSAPPTETKADATAMTTLPAVTPSSPDVPAPVVTEAAPPAKAADASARPPPPAVPKASGTGAFQVQIAAFSDAKLAADLAKKATAAGFPAHTEEVPTQRGSVHRVRVGPYATRAAADSAVGKLKAIGIGNAQVVAAK